MSGVNQIFFFLLFFVFFRENFSLPAEKANTKTMNFRAYVPKLVFSRQKRAEGEEQSGIQEVLTTAIKDGIAASSVLESPTMVIGSFSVMMQPMPKGSEMADQFMKIVPHYMSLLPGVGR